MWSQYFFRSITVTSQILTNNSLKRKLHFSFINIASTIIYICLINYFWLLLFWKKNVACGGNQLNSPWQTLHDELRPERVRRLLLPEPRVCSACLENNYRCYLLFVCVVSQKCNLFIEFFYWCLSSDKTVNFELYIFLSKLSNYNSPINRTNCCISYSEHPDPDKLDTGYVFYVLINYSPSYLHIQLTPWGIIGDKDKQS